MPGRGSGAIRRGACLTLVMAMVAAGGPRGSAETDTGQLNVSATVLSGCTLIGGTLDFGIYVSGQASDLDATGEIRYVNCSGRLIFELGAGSHGSVDNRKMRGPDGTLDYKIFRAANSNDIWGMSEANAVVIDLPLNGTPSSGFVPVYGRIRGGQAVPGGSYTDIVNITLTFD